MTDPDSLDPSITFAVSVHRKHKLIAVTILDTANKRSIDIELNQESADELQKALIAGLAKLRD